MDITDKQEKEIADSYLSSLVDLTSNSKPLINMLTMLAEENIEHGQTIVDAVEQRIAKVEPELKLPILYLIDSIVKNVGREYTTLFSHSIVNIFCGVFEKVNEQIRHKMFALRQTWNDVFSPTKLYALDIKVNSIDPGWPITKKISPAIHVNPNFFSTTSETDLQTKLQIKQRELLELKAQKLELELAATQKQLGLTPTTAVVVDPKKMLNQKEVLESFIKSDAERVQNIYQMVHKQQPIGLGPPSNHNFMGQVAPVNVRQRIAPVNPALVSSVRLRDPRLMRQTPQQQQQQQALNHNQQQQQPIPEYNAPVVNPRIGANFANNTNRNRGQRFPQTNLTPYTEINKSNSNSNNSSDTNNKNARKDDKSRSASSPSSHKSLPKSIADGKSSGSSSSKSKSSMSSSSSSARSSSLKADRSSSQSGNSPRSSSSSSSSKESKERKDKSKSPQRKKSSSRNRSPSSTSSRRSTSPRDLQNSPRKSTYDSKSSPKSSDGGASMVKTTTHNHHSKENSTKSSPTRKSRDFERHSQEQPKSPTSVLQSVDIAAKDVDLRAELPHPITLNSSPLINSMACDPDITTSSDASISTPADANMDDLKIAITNVDAVNSTNISEQKLNEAASKDVDLRVGIIPAIVSSPTAAASDPKKRLSDEQMGSDEPKPKKSKSEKIDILFGKEDVDLRIVPLNPITPPPPPIISTAVTPPIEAESGWSKGKDPSSGFKKTPPKAALDAVRAKLAEATKCGMKNLNRDVDLRQRLEIIDENSQEVNDKLKLILIQAQEQVENENVNKDQIKSLVQQMMKIKKDTDARKSYKRCSGGVKPRKSYESDENEAFSSDSGDENLKQSHRVPTKRRRASPPARQSTTGEIGTTNANISSVSKINDASKAKTIDAPATAPKERRPRKTKWSSPWEETPKPLNVVPMPPIPPTSLIKPMPFPLRQPQPMPSNMGIWQQNPIPFKGPSGVHPMGIMNIAQLPPNLLGGPQIIMAQHGSNIASYSAKERTINIDNIPREIRFYDETAIAFMKEDGNDPKEIGFQSGERRLCVDNNESILLAFNDTYKPFVINGKQYQIRFGSPTRELYIDNEWYECFFGDPPVGIFLDNKLHAFKIDGPAPQVRIGNLRTDLVVGKVDMYIDIITKVSLFLDAQVQMFQVNNQMHSIQFADYFLTVLIDNVPFPVQYGAMPMKFQLPNAEHYIRFSVLPNDIIPGKVYVRNMVRTNMHRDLVSPPPNIIPNTVSTVPSIPPATGPIVPLMSLIPNPDIITAGSSTANELQKVSNQPPSSQTSESSNPASTTMNINDLYQKLLATGIINKLKEASPTKEKEKATPVSLAKTETLKKRQAAIVHTLYSGMQCSSCGVRFPLEQTMKYSQHLDWHYRQNRRERDSARRAHSRKWFYDVPDWIQYEEIENLDEREKNWFETQQTDMDSANEESNQRTDSPPPSCVAGPDDHNKTCDMCHDQFETFYNEETEEWHLRNAVRIDDNTYHPVCYEDYKASLTLDESNLNASNLGDISTDDNAVDLPIKKEKSDLSRAIDEEIALDDDDDVIVLPQEEPVITEIPDDDDNELNAHTTNTNGNETATAEVPSSSSPNASLGQKSSDEEKANGDQEEDVDNNNESDVQILEPQISIMNLDEYEETPETNVTSTTLDDSQLISSVKIKKEPKYEGYEEDEDDGFEDVGTFEGEPEGILDETSEEYTPQPVHSQQTLIASIDGNVELQDAQPTTFGTNKIKINITKNVQLNKNPINCSENIDNNLAINNNVLGSGASATSANSTANDTEQNENGVERNATEIEYELKDSIKHVQFKRQPVVRSGLETSGLCSIM